MALFFHNANRFPFAAVVLCFIPRHAFDVLTVSSPSVPRFSCRGPVVTCPADALRFARVPGREEVKCEIVVVFHSSFLSAFGQNHLSSSGKNFVPPLLTALQIRNVPIDVASRSSHLQSLHLMSSHTAPSCLTIISLILLSFLPLSSNPYPESDNAS